MPDNRRSYLLLLIGLLFLSSCVSQKKMRYLYEDDDTGKVLHENIYRKEYRIQPGDNLYIQVLGLDTQTADLFSLQPGTSRQYLNNDLSVFLTSYTVNQEGFIEFPIIGSVLVRDKTIDEIKVLVQEAISEYMRDATVVVKMVNFRITLLGEVIRPGHIPVYQNRVNIFEALAMAGDMGTWGDRKNVQLLRSTPSGTEIHSLDLTSRRILESEFYFLMPDDVIYVPPLRSKTYAFTTFPYSVVFSTITTALLILNFFK